MQPEYIPEDLTINDMESIVEIILEKGLGIENAISEHDEPDEGDAGSIELSKDFKVYGHPSTLKFLDPKVYLIEHTSIYTYPPYKSYIDDIVPPPPKSIS